MSPEQFESTIRQALMDVTPDDKKEEAKEHVDKLAKYLTATLAKKVIIPYLEGKVAGVEQDPVTQLLAELIKSKGKKPVKVAGLADTVH